VFGARSTTNMTISDFDSSPVASDADSRASVKRYAEIGSKGSLPGFFEVLVRTLGKEDDVCNVGSSVTFSR